MAELGRPTDYSEEILAKAKEYIATYEELGDKIPSVAGLSVYLKIARSTIYDWASQEDKKDFSDTLQELLAKQESTLLNKGLVNEFNSTITKLALSNHHNYKEKSDVTTNDQPIENKTIVGNIERVYGSTGELPESSEG